MLYIFTKNSCESIRLESLYINVKGIERTRLTPKRQPFQPQLQQHSKQFDNMRLTHMIFHTETNINTKYQNTIFSQNKPVFTNGAHAITLSR